MYEKKMIVKRNYYDGCRTDNIIEKIEKRVAEENTKEESGKKKGSGEKRLKEDYLKEGSARTGN